MDEILAALAEGARAFQRDPLGALAEQARDFQRDPLGLEPGAQAFEQGDVGEGLVLTLLAGLGMTPAGRAGRAGAVVSKPTRRQIEEEGFERAFLRQIKEVDARIHTRQEPRVPTLEEILRESEMPAPGPDIDYGMIAKNLLEREVGGIWASLTSGIIEDKARGRRQNPGIPFMMQQRR